MAIIIYYISFTRNTKISIFLNTLKLVLNPDFSVQLYATNKLFISAPFAYNDVDNKAIILLNRKSKNNELGFTVGCYFDEEDSEIMITYDLEKRILSLTILGINYADYTFK